MGNKIHIIGSGFSSLSASCYLAKEGYEVHVYEKNEQLGGRARQLEHEGFKFDMGPSWYWMPDVFERFFSDLGKNVNDYYSLDKLGPAYRVYFAKGDYVDIGDNLESIINTFESIEEGSGNKLRSFIKKAKQNYSIAIENLVYKPGLSPLELINLDTVIELKQFYFSVHDYVKKNFSNPKLQKILEFPVLFLGAKPSNTPLFYSFMNFADFGLGTWYPKGGMKAVVDAFIRLAKELGVFFHTNASINSIEVDDDKQVEGMWIKDTFVDAKVIISGADYKHSESLLERKYRAYSEAYWDKKVMAPSSLLFYIGFSEEIKDVLHHTLFFDVSFDEHAQEIYDNPAWPKNPLFYASFASKSDASIAPEGKEAAVFLIPLAPGLNDNEELRQLYFNKIMDRMELLCDKDIRSKVLFQKSYCVNDFKEDYNSFKGNAYGMANTLLQTAFLRPKIRSKKVKNLYFTGQLTVPGPGVPPSIISGKLVADLVKTKNPIYIETLV